MHRLKSGAMALLVAVAGAGTSIAQDENDRQQDEQDSDAIHCVRVQGIQRIDIVDSDTLVFRMRNGKVYRNDLPYNCPGLRRDDTLMYRTTIGQVCDLDIVTVLEDWGFGFAPGVSCGLGVFHPITGQIADELMRAKQ